MSAIIDLSKFNLSEDWVNVSLLLTLPVGLYCYNSGMSSPMIAFALFAFAGPYLYSNLKSYI
jgi:hypothetical protein